MNVLLIDDHALFRQGLKFLLSSLDDKLEFFEASSCDEAVALASSKSVQLLLLDFYLPGVDGFDALKTAKEAFESSIVVILSGEHSSTVIRESIERGAAGFIPKSSSHECLIAALKLILAGGVYIPGWALSAFSDTTPKTHNGRRAFDALSDRQLEVLLKAVRGNPSKVIAREVGISESTVKVHLSNAYRVLGVKNKVGAFNMAADCGLLPRSSNSQKDPYLQQTKPPAVHSGDGPAGHMLSKA